MTSIKCCLAAHTAICICAGPGVWQDFEWKVGIWGSSGGQLYHTHVAEGREVKPG